MTLRIPVTEDHIRQGERGSAHSCPIALALRESGCEHVTVRHYNIMYWPENSGDGWEGARVHRPSARLRAWISRFDANRKVEPFVLVLRDGTARKESA